jgi:hypothetical protein
MKQKQANWKEVRTIDELEDAAAHHKSSILEWSLLRDACS